jgi:hypothetical protein
VTATSFARIGLRRPTKPGCCIALTLALLVGGCLSDDIHRPEVTPVLDQSVVTQLGVPVDQILPRPGDSDEIALVSDNTLRHRFLSATREPRSGWIDRCEQAAVSADGQWLIWWGTAPAETFSLLTVPQNERLWCMRADGTDLRELGFLPRNPHALAITDPDHIRVLMSLSDSLFIWSDVTGQDARYLTPRDYRSGHRFSPGGGRLLFDDRSDPTRTTRWTLYDLDAETFRRIDLHPDNEPEELGSDRILTVIRDGDQVGWLDLESGERVLHSPLSNVAVAGTDADGGLLVATRDGSVIRAAPGADEWTLVAAAPRLESRPQALLCSDGEPLLLEVTAARVASRGRLTGEPTAPWVAIEHELLIPTGPSLGAWDPTGSRLALVVDDPFGRDSLLVLTDDQISSGLSIRGAHSVALFWFDAQRVGILSGWTSRRLLEVDVTSGLVRELARTVLDGEVAAAGWDPLHDRILLVTDGPIARGLELRLDGTIRELSRFSASPLSIALPPHPLVDGMGPVTVALDPEAGLVVIPVLNPGVRVRVAGSSFRVSTAALLPGRYLALVMVRENPLGLRLRSLGNEIR